MPAEEIRGSMELEFVDSELAKTRPKEVAEKDIPPNFDDAFAHEGETLRNLDLFFFCDEQGRPLSLEILDLPKDQRPRIMGFGTIVEHLPLVERPLPVKPLLPSPAFPSRSKKRPRVEQTAPPASKSSSSRPSSANKSRKKAKVVDGGPQDEYIFQGDGAFDNATELEPRQQAGESIFQRSTVYHYQTVSKRNPTLQLDGQSDSDSESGLTSDDEDMNSTRSFSRSEANSETHSTAGSNTTNSDSGSDSENSSSESSSSSDAESSEDSSRPRVIEEDVGNYASGKSEGASSNLPTGKAEAKPPSAPRRVRKDSNLDSIHPDVSELMRTDRSGTVAAKGTEDELNLLECGFRHPPEYARMRVWLPEITDWCLDFSEGDPTLWVVTPLSWYKIAGPLSGLLPHHSYRGTFQHVRMLFEASYLVAYVLKEWLPINKKVSYRATLQQVIELSLAGRYRVSSWFLMENYPFLRNQISNLFPDKELYLESMFFRQLHRLHESYRVREEKLRREMAEKERRRIDRESERIRKKQRVEDERQKWRDQREEVRKLREEERKYPIEDLELLEDEDERSKAAIPLSSSDFDGVTGSLLGELIMAWQTISTFRSFVGIQAISLEALAACITSKSTTGTQVGLVKIFMAFLKVILAEKSFTSLLDDLVVEGNIKVSDLFVNTERTYGICERPYTDMLNAITWQEILRQLMSKALGIDPSIGHVEPLVGCEIVRQTLYMQANSAPFNAPVDTTLKGLEDYPDIIKRPMDLGTIKKKIDTGGYEGNDGYENFAADVRLVWENAVLYNGEESEVGRAALALSDIFEQDYERFVVGRVRANQSRSEGCKREKEELSAKKSDEMDSFTYAGVVYGLYSFEFHELPIAYKIGALSWICNEFLNLSSVRTYIASQLEQENVIVRNHRKLTAEIDTRRKHQEKARREKELAFRQECISQGILPNSHNVFSEGTKRKYEYIGQFYEELQKEKAEEENLFELEKKAQHDDMTRELRSVIIRELPLGKDRYHNRYWIFQHDSRPRLYVEKNDTGEVLMCRTKEQLDALMAWLNPRGVRELELIAQLTKAKEQLEEALAATAAPEDEAKPTVQWENSKGGIELELFPLPGGAVKGGTHIISDSDDVVESLVVVKEMLLCLQRHLANANTLPSDWKEASEWTTRVKEATSFNALRDLFAEIEDVAVTASSGAVETIRRSWKRKRHEWRLALEGACTFAQVVFLLHLLLEEFINVEAFLDLYIRLDRRDWLKLRAKDARNFIPEEGKQVVYFGDGHFQALKEDEKIKKKRVSQKGDAPLRSVTAICTVDKVSYHHGGGDPYALAVLRPLADLNAHGSVRKPGDRLCPLPSPQQRLARILLRIIAKIRVHADAGPFLEPVSDREFPEYKEIVLHPIDLGKIAKKARQLEYKRGSDLFEDMRLMCNNCELFCEGRFPMLPPLARNLLLMAQALLKKSAKEIDAAERAATSGEDPGSVVPKAEAQLKEASHTEPLTRSIVAILRLENRLPEYVVDVARYTAAVSRTWHAGDRFRMLFRNPQGVPGEYYFGVTAGSLPFDARGLLPWDALYVTWDEDDGGDNHRINPWEAEPVRNSK